MKYFIDCEFDVWLRKLISMAVVREDCEIIYICFKVDYVKDPWVKDNVLPILGAHKIQDVRVNVFHADFPYAREQLATWFALDDTPIQLLADHPADFSYFCDVIDYKDGKSVLDNFTMEVVDVQSWPNDLEGAVRHNAVWDALALRERLSKHDVG